MGTTEQSEAERNALVMQVQHMFRGIVGRFCERHSILSEREEILSAVNVQALRWAGIYDPTEAEWTTYAYACAEKYCRTAWHNFINRQAANFSDIVPVDSEEIDLTVSKEPAPDAHILSQASRNEIKAAMDHLTPRERQILTLRFWGGKNLSVIADKLGVSKQRVQQLEIHGLNHLREILQGVPHKSNIPEWHKDVKEHQLSEIELRAWKQISTGIPSGLSAKQVDNCYQRIRRKCERNKKDSTSH